MAAANQQIIAAAAEIDKAYSAVDAQAKQHAERVAGLERTIAQLREELSVSRQRHQDDVERLLQAKVKQHKAEEALASEMAIPRWRTISAWSKIRQGMDEDEVAQILGDAPFKPKDPDHKHGHLEKGVYVNDDYDWFYPNRDPSSGRVRFDTATHTVIEWVCPSFCR